MAIHECETCGLVHDHGEARVNPEVEIARLQAESAVEIARLQAHSERHVAEIQAEAQVESVEVAAEAQAESEAVAAMAGVEEAAAVAEVLEDHPEAAPILVPEPVEDEDDEMEPPDTGSHEAPSKPRGLGMW